MRHSGCSPCAVVCYREGRHQLRYSRRRSAHAAAQMLKGQSAVKWSFAPLETLYDVDSIISRWTETGVVVRRGSTMHTPPARTDVVDMVAT